MSMARRVQVVREKVVEPEHFFASCEALRK